MTKAVKELLSLPVEERLEVAQLLWESFEPADEARFLPIPEWQRDVLEDRLKDMAANPDDQQDWEAVKAELWPAR